MTELTMMIERKTSLAWNNSRWYEKWICRKTVCVTFVFIEWYNKTLKIRKNIFEKTAWN